MTYPRFGVPSASGMRRNTNCLGSFKMEQKVQGLDTRDSQSGDRVHGALAGTLSPLQLTWQERDTFAMCSAQEERLINEWATPNQPRIIIREKRLGMTEIGNVIEVTLETKAKLIFTGQADVTVIEGDRGFTADFKSLYGEVPDAVENEQMLSLAVLTSRKYHLDEKRVAIIQPRVGWPTKADYDGRSLNLAYDWLRDSLESIQSASENDLTPWTPDKEGSNWCGNCAARFFCPAFKDVALQQIDVVNPMSIAGLPGKEQRAAMYARLMELPAARHAAARRGLPMVKRYVDAMESSSIDRAAHDPEFQRYYALEAGGQGDRMIEDPQAALNALAAHGITAAQALECCKMSVTKLETLLRVNSGVKRVTEAGVIYYNMTAKEAKEAIENMPAGIMTRKEPAMELVEVKQKEGGNQ